MDIKWWRDFFPLYNGVSLMLDNKWSYPDEVLASNSCFSGGGAFVVDEYMHFQFPQFVLRKCSHINQLECVVLTGGR